MKKQFLLALIVVLALGAMSASASGTITKHYNNVDLDNWGKGNFPELWDLTQCDLELSYSIDMSAIATAGWAVTEVGLREVGAPNLDPNLKGGWMQSNYVSAASNPNTQNNNDLHILSKHGWMYQDYDAESADMLVPPYWSGANYGFWFDRDGVDEWQAQMWGMDGTYNTGGVYDITITYHAIDADTGTMFATINGVQQGLYIGGWKDAQPEFYPAGKSFTGDTAQMQVFYGRGGGGGTVTLSNLSVTGCLYWTEVDIDLKPCSAPNSINLKSKGKIPVAILSTDGFDATTVDPATVAFAGADPLRWTVEDVCPFDGKDDLLFHFKTQELELDETCIEASLTGHTFDGEFIWGTDTVNIVPKGK